VWVAGGAGEEMRPGRIEGSEAVWAEAAGEAGGSPGDRLPGAPGAAGAAGAGRGGVVSELHH